MTISKTLEKTCDWVQSEMRRLHIPGTALGILHDSEIFTAGFGVTNLENPLPVSPDTLFQTGSITKTFTATAMMRLVERGLVNLDAPIRAILPELQLADESVTEKASLRHVFSHTGGWMGDFFDDAGSGDDALAVVVARMNRLPQEMPIGEIWSYNNAGYYLAGRGIEVLTGESYENAVRKLVLEPLGMDRSFFFARDAITYRVAAGHSAVYPGDENIPEVLRPWWLARASNPLGGLLSTANDLLRYARFHMSDGVTSSGERILEPEGMAIMQTPGVAAANGERMGVSWFLSDLDGVQILRHGGSTNGQMATLQIIPEREFALVVLTNSDRGNELYQPLVRNVLAEVLDLVETDPQPIRASPAELRLFAGCYDAAAQTIFLDMIEDNLLLRIEPKGGFPTPDSPPSPAPPPTRLALTGTDRAIALDEPFKGNQGEFLRDTQGNLVWLRFSGRVHRRQ